MSDNKLFKVEITFDIYVLAKDATEAKQVAKSNEADELGNGYADYHVQEAKTLAEIDANWRESIPYKKDYRSNDNRSVEDILTGE